MDHSLAGYLSRRSTEELRIIIAMYKHLREDKAYKEILEIAEEQLHKRIQEGEFVDDTKLYAEM